MDRTIAFLLLAGITLLLVPLGFSLVFMLYFRNRPAPPAANGEAAGVAPRRDRDDDGYAPGWDRPLDEWRIARLERRLDLILAHLGIEDHHDPREAARALLRAGRRGQAIRAYRGETGAGLQEATREIEVLERELKQSG